jgi:hypothetical protein
VRMAGIERRWPMRGVKRPTVGAASGLIAPA